MKKILAAALACLFMLTLFSCDNGDDISLVSSSASSENGVSEAVSEPVSEEETVSKEESKDPFVLSEKIAVIDSFMTTDVDRTMKAKNVFSGMKYDYPVIVPSEEDYPDKDKNKLTDNVTRDLFDSFSWVGFYGDPKPEIVFDLGEGGGEIADIEVNMLNQTSYGISLPKSVIVSASRDGEEYTVLGEVVTPVDQAASSKYVYRFAFPKATDARYIKITLYKRGAGWTFIDEIIGYKYCADGTIDVSAGATVEKEDAEYDYYNYNLNTSPDRVTVSSSDPDYDLYQNLARLPGTEVQVSHFDPMSAEVCGANTNIDKIRSKISDGVKASSPTYTDSAFIIMSRGYGRHFVFDLGTSMSVDKVNLEFLNFVTAGVGVPPTVVISASNDGKNWVTVSGEFTGVYGDREVKNYDISCAFKNSVKARYIRCSFATVPSYLVTSLVYMSEVEIWGKKNTSGASEPAYDKSIIAGNYPDVSNYQYENILFAPVQEISAGTMTVDNSTAYIGYMKDGVITDTFCDSVCFARSNQTFVFDDAAQTVTKFINEMFTAGYNVDALNTIVGNVNKALGKNDKVTVWFDIFPPEKTTKCDMDGDGKLETLSSLEARIDFCKWQIDRYLEKFKTVNYENIEILGFYWNRECILEADRINDAKLAAAVNEYIHSLNYQSVWCPYYNAYGIWMWKEIGFDMACLQPNYMFYATEKTRLRTTSEIARLYGMCVEMEIEDYGSEGACGLYREYIREAYDSGHMNSIKFYYQGSVPGSLIKAMNAPADYSRAIYTDSYLYSKGLIGEDYNKGTASDLDGYKDITLTAVHEQLAKGSLGALGDCSVRYMLTPLYGSIAITNAGSITYTPLKNFAGSDKAVLEISDTAGNTKLITIDITITEE